MRKPPNPWAPKKAPKPPSPYRRDFALEEFFRPFIESRRVVQFVSSGRLRTAEPYLLGYNHVGHLELSAFQLSGGSGVDWRGFLAHELSGVAATQATFDGQRAGYNPHDPSMQLIVCHV
jgi:hypothetical protein